MRVWPACSAAICVATMGCATIVNSDHQATRMLEATFQAAATTTDYEYCEARDALLAAGKKDRKLLRGQQEGAATEQERWLAKIMLARVEQSQQLRHCRTNQQ